MSTGSEIAQAEHWLKTVILGQPVHREEMGEEDASSGTLRGISPTVLKLAPQLEQAMRQELANAPKFEGPQISVPGMRPGGNSSSMPNLNRRQPKPPSGESGNKD